MPHIILPEWPKKSRNRYVKRFDQFFDGKVYALDAADYGTTAKRLRDTLYSAARAAKVNIRTSVVDDKLVVQRMSHYT